MELAEGLDGPVLVTGATGFVGARLFTSLSQVRDDVYAMVKNEKGWRLADVADDRIIRCDMTDFGSTAQTIEKLKPRTVFHLVSYGAYPFEGDEALIYETNVASLINLVHQLSSCPISAFVHAGTSSEYGSNCSGPAEDSAQKPNSTYAASKVAAANFLQFAGEHQRFPSINLRLYSVYGPLEDTSRLIPRLVHEALQSRLPPLVEKQITRDFIHVDDVCAAFVQAAVSMDPEIYGSSFNIGTGQCTSISDLVEVVRRSFDVSEQPLFGSMENRAWDLSDWYSDPTRARELLGWRAEIGLEDGLRSVADWISEIPESTFWTRTKSKSGALVEAGGRSVSAIVACYRDSEAIPQMYKRLTDVFTRLGIDYEIVFVNDGSPDDSEQIICEITGRDHQVVGVTHSRNFGSQMAFRSGMEIASKDAVVLLDGDLQDPPEIIEKFHHLWLNGHDVVYGIRTEREMSWIRSIGHKSFYRLFRKFSYVDIPVDAGDFSLMDRRVVEWILESPERDVFIRGLRAYVGFRQTGVEYVRPKRMFGESTNNLSRNINWAKRGIFSFSDAPLTMLTMLGFVGFAFSTVSMLVVFMLRLLVPDIAPRGTTTVLMTILLFGSVNLLGIGIVGEYVAKIMTEVKRRPRLIRSAIIRSGKVSALGRPDQDG